MNPVQSSPELNSRFSSCPHGQKLTPEEISEKKWLEEHDDCGANDKFTWSGTTLSISLQYAGGHQHTFKAYILKNMPIEDKSFTIFIEDLVKNDYLEGNMYSTIDIDLAKYADPGATFKIMRSGWGNSAYKVGETTFCH